MRNPQSDPLDFLEQLRECSLIQAEEGAPGMRFRMMETLRDFAGEQLAGNEREALSRRHAEHYLALAETAATYYRRADQTSWIDRLERDNDNLRAAFAWCRAEPHRAAIQLRLALSLWRFWEVRGYYREGRQLLAEALEAAGAVAGIPEELRADALHGAGFLAWRQGDLPAACELHEQCLVLRRRRGDRRGEARALVALGNAARKDQDPEGARAYREQSLAIFRELEDRAGVAAALNKLGVTAMEEEDYPRARSLFEESLELHRELGDRWGASVAVGNLSRLAARHGDFLRARCLREESLDLDLELGHKWGIAGSLEAFASLAAQEGCLEHAARLFGASEALREAIGSVLPVGSRSHHHRHVALTRDGLGEPAFTTAWTAGGA
jgi:tetratricopeptide (TPR) repeat protein